MWSYAVSRLFQAIIVVIAVTLITFLTLQMSGDPTYLYVSDRATDEEIAMVRERLGFDRPLHVQYLSFLGGLVQGDTGRSLVYRLPAFGVVMERLPATIELTLTAMLIAVVFAIPLGIIAALNRGTAIDGGIMALAMVGQSIPSFWLGIMLILGVGLGLSWLPISGHVPVLEPLLQGDVATAIGNVPQALRYLIMPAFTISLFSLSRNARLVRSSMLEVLSQDFVRTARAKGLKEWGVVMHHALRNAWMPVVTMLGLEFGFLLSGVVVVETVFSWPGVGRLVFNAINQRDIPLVQTAVVVFAFVFVLLNLFVDVIYARLDPRVRLVTAPTASTATAAKAAPSAAMRAWTSLVRKVWPLLAIIVLLLVTLAAVAGPSLAPKDPNRQNIIARLQPPMTADRTGVVQFPLGTDALGRDVLSRLIYGARVSLLVGLTAVLIGGTLGTALGIIAGYFGGRIDAFIMRIADIQLAFPFILLAIMFLVVLGSGVLNLILILGIGQWVTYARIARAQTLSQREKEYVEAARALGARGASVMFKSILPNILAPLIVIASFNVASVILSEASLSFLGLGVPPTTPTWGGMLAESRDQLLAGRWWLAVYPGVAIALTVLAFNILGDWLRDFLDPRLRGVG